MTTYQVISKEDAYKQMDEQIDENEKVKIGTLEYSASRVLKEIDPVAYNESFCSFTDGLREDTILVREDFREGEYFSCEDCDKAYDTEEERNECHIRTDQPEQTNIEGEK